MAVEHDMAGVAGHGGLMVIDITVAHLVQVKLRLNQHVFMVHFVIGGEAIFWRNHNRTVLPHSRVHKYAGRTAVVHINTGVVGYPLKADSLPWRRSEEHT